MSGDIWHLFSIQTVNVREILAAMEYACEPSGLIILALEYSNNDILSWLMRGM